MRTYKLFVTYSIWDEVEVEADTLENAIEQFEYDWDHRLVPYDNHRNFTLIWDEINIDSTDPEFEDEDELV